ncbi:MAG: SelB C-terminal domain-containing protein, partial [Coriobacteriia bacterium]|nr:SelB C-terminal domain-containing protein [Coriobacteriia bacterium]
CRACDAVAKRPRTDTARLPIDRVFTIDGAGTVVTGTLWEGSIAHDNVLELWPSGARARVRSIQVHGASCAKAVAGQRVALNLGGVKHGDVSRGDVLATPDALHGVARFNAHLRYLGLPRERAECLECGRQVHVHHGTREVIGRIKLLHENCTPAPLEPGETAFVQLYLDDPLPLRFGDRFIIRSFSPLFTIGGGQVLETDASPRKRVDAGELDVLDGLRRKDFEAVLPDLATIRGVPVTANALANKVGITEADAAKILDRSLLAHVKTAQETIYLSAEALKQTCSRIEEELLAFHKANPRALDISVRALMRLVWQQADSPQAQAWTDSRFEAVLATMAQAGTLCVEAGKVRHAQAASSAQALHDQVAETLLTRLDEQGLMVEGISALASALEQPIPLIAQVLGELVRSGQLVRLASDFHFTKRHIQAAEKQLRDGLGANAPGKDGLTAAEVRDLWQVSRKYAIPLLEYFDAQGITKREGELRFLA